jgi:hypothetical protein
MIFRTPSSLSADRTIVPLLIPLLDGESIETGFCRTLGLGGLPFPKVSEIDGTTYFMQDAGGITRCRNNNPIMGAARAGKIGHSWHHCSTGCLPDPGCDRSS